MEMIEIEAFVAIAECGTFTQAATLLHCSQPAISRRIQLLESELGAPLFERIHSGVQLTDVGKAFQPHARSVLASVGDGAAVHEILNGDGGTITLDALESASLVATVPVVAIHRRDGYLSGVAKRLLARIIKG